MVGTGEASHGYPMLAAPIVLSGLLLGRRAMYVVGSERPSHGYPMMVTPITTCRFWLKEVGLISILIRCSSIGLCGVLTWVGFIATNM